MAHHSTELEKKSERRRNSGEQVFERNAVASSANATTGESVPPWLAGTGVFESYAAPSSVDAACATTTADVASSDPGGEPPWLRFADSTSCAWAGSSEFDAALRKIQAFERERASRGLGMCAHLPSEEESEALEGQDPPWLQYCDAEWCIVPATGSDKPENVEESPEPDVAFGSDQTAALAADSDAAAPDRMVAKRQDLKSAVQTRYFQLLERGLDPNAAASRAILEAAGLKAESAEATDGAGPALRTTKSSGSSSGSPRSTSHRSCASSAQGSAVEGRRRRKQIAVGA